MKRAIAMITLALLIGSGLPASYVGATGGTRARGFSGQGGANEPQRINREFRANMGQKLEFEIETGGRIDVIGWDNQLISVEVYKGGRDAADCRIDFQETASGLKITSEYVGRGHSYSTNISFLVRVPKRFDLEFDSMGGGISICGVEGRFSGKTMGGGLTLNNLKGDIDLMTMGGRITVTNSELEGRVETMGGGVLLENVLGDLRGSTMGGQVERRNNGDRAGRTSETQCAPAPKRDV